MQHIDRLLATTVVVVVMAITILAVPIAGSMVSTDSQHSAVFVEEATIAVTPVDDANVTSTTTAPVGIAAGYRFQPFTGSSAAIPGQIEAEDYDTGGQGWGWSDRTPGNQGGAYREDDVDIETGGSGYAVAYVKSSEWLTYSVDVRETGSYTATFRCSSPWTDREIWVWVDGVLKGKATIPNTGSFATYEDATAELVLPAGNHYIRLQFVRDAQNIDYMTFVMAGEPNATPSPSPTGTFTPEPTQTGNVTGTPTPDGGGNVTPTPTGNMTPEPTVNITDLTNQNSPEAAMIVGNASMTMLHASNVSIGLQRIAGNFTSPLFVADAKDGSGRLFVVDQTGYVQIMYSNGTVIDQPFLDVRDRMVDLLPGYDERGLLSIAFHPNFSSNGKVYAFYSAPLRAGADPSWNCTNRLSEFNLSSTDSNMVDMSTERVLLEIDKPQMNHNGGILLFGPTDGYLYLTLGDGGGANDTGIGHTPGIGNAQDLSTLHGKIIRIDVDSTIPGKEYGIPTDNPFLSNLTVPPEIYAYGFRNPAFASFDSIGGRMFVAMAGQNLFESVLVLYRGGAYPWSIREGTHCFDPANNDQVPNQTCRITSDDDRPLIGPIAELGHDVGNTVVGGVVYRGSALAALQGSYLFGTWSTSFAAGDGTLLIATPPAGLDTTMLPEDAASLTPEQNAMWTTSEVTVENNADGRIHAFVRGLYETTDREILILINQNPGPGVSPQNSGEVWQVVAPDTPGLIGIGNGSSAPNTTPTASPTPTTVTPTVTATSDGTMPLTITAQGLAFDTSTLTVPANATVTLTFVNNDESIPHNVAVYTDSSAGTPIFIGQVITGPATTTYTFTAPATPGSYFFRCDIHPTMTGTFVVT
jgi:glucose/arabinose dehydrogenase